MRQQAHDNLQRHIQDKLPEEYQRCLTGINQVLKLSWQIANNNNNSGQEDSNRSSKTITTITEKEKIRLQAAALANDCYKYIMDLTTNGVIITDAIKFVQTNREKLTTSKEEESGKGSKEPNYDEDKDQPEEKQEDAGEIDNTTNQVF